jgi:hypothetical protein
MDTWKSVFTIYVNKILFWIIMAKNRNCPKITDESLQIN